MNTNVADRTVGNQPPADDAGASRKSESVADVAREIRVNVEKLGLDRMKFSTARVQSGDLAMGKSADIFAPHLARVLEQGNAAAKMYAKRLRDALGAPKQATGPTASAVTASASVTTTPACPPPTGIAPDAEVDRLVSSGEKIADSIPEHEKPVTPPAPAGATVTAAKDPVADQVEPVTHIVDRLLPIVRQVSNSVKLLGLRGKAVSSAKNVADAILADTEPSKQLQAAIALATYLRKGNARAQKFAEHIVDCLQMTLPGIVDSPEATAPLPANPSTTLPVLRPRLLRADHAEGVVSMTPEVLPPEATGEHAGSTDAQRKPDIPLNALGISRWNRSCGLRPDRAYQERLVESIRLYGMLHPVTLVRDPDDREAPYKILAGANRTTALSMIRSDDQVLHPHEYVVLDDITEADPKCLQISLAENADRRESSPYELAVYVRRLIEKLHLNKKVVADAMHTHPSTISRLLALAQAFERLPEGWREDLQSAPGLESNQAPAITLGHFSKVATQLVEAGPSEALLALMQRARDELWSVAKFGQALDTLRPPPIVQKAGGKISPPPVPEAEPGKGGDEQAPATALLAATKDAEGASAPKEPVIAAEPGKAAATASTATVDQWRVLLEALSTAERSARVLYPELADEIETWIHRVGEMMIPR